jgi:rhodanese-related sulfurtransferase
MLEAPGIQPAEVDVKVADGWTLLDVRTAPEWADVHLNGSRHLPMDQVVARLDEVPDRVICVCAVGARSARVADYLQAQGREAVNLEGGIQAWLAEGRPVAGAN